MWFLAVGKHITLLFETFCNKYAFCNTVMTYVCVRTRYIYSNSSKALKCDRVYCFPKQSTELCKRVLG